MNSVFVSGATSGLGRAIAQKFLEAGKTVYLHGRRSDDIKDLLEEPNCRFFRHDLLDLKRIHKITDFIISEEIDCFVSNAGVYSGAGAAISSRVCAEVLITNLVAPVIIMTKLYARYQALRRGIIVCINSLAGINPNFDELVYCASKHGLRGFIKSLQMDAARHNVRVLDYYPGAIQTRMTQKRRGFQEFIKPEDLASLIVSNVTSRNSYEVVSQEVRRALAG